MTSKDPNKAPTHVALLRGINVGGNKKVPMADLKAMFEEMGYTNVKTLLNTGNVLFVAKGSEAKLAQKLEKEFENTFGFTSNFIVRPLSDIKKLVTRDPFKKVKVTPDIRLYVTFLRTIPKNAARIMRASQSGAYRVLELKDNMLLSVLDLSKGKGTTDAMDAAAKELSKDITTRNWNTVKKMVR